MTVKPLRADAARNRELLLGAAAQVFAEQGLAASVEEVARVAGVGMGTLYRRFPTKEDLVEELVRAVLTRFSALALDAAAAPAGQGLDTFLRSATALLAEHRGCLPRLWNTSAEHELVQEARGRIALLLTEAKEHGTVRDEITATDLTVALFALRGVIESTPGTTAWPRHLEVVLAGLRPSAQPLVNPPVPQRDLDRVLSLKP